MLGGVLLLLPQLLRTSSTATGNRSTMKPPLAHAATIISAKNIITRSAATGGGTVPQPLTHAPRWLGGLVVATEQGDHCRGCHSVTAHGVAQQ